MTKEEPGFIYETEYWRIILADDQTNLGRCVIVLKRACPNLSSLTNEEWLDFTSAVVQKLETIFKREFGAVMFNWTCLMNDAYKKKPYNPQVHWHFRPRYDKKVKIGKEVFTDDFFGNHYERGSDRRVSAEIRGEIIKRIKKFL